MAIEYNNLIRSVSYDQHSILKDIIDMHNGGRPFDADITYSIGAFYGHFKRTMNDGSEQEYDIPRPRFTFDVCPQDDETIKLEPWGNIPLDDNSVDSICVDLPFVVAPRDSASTKKENEKEGSNITFKRFSSYYPFTECMASYAHWLTECYRVLKEDGILVWKTQASVTGSKQMMTPEWSWLYATSLGFDTLDQFFLIAKARLNSGKIKTQQHARKFSSTFFVFKKSIKKRINYLDYMCEDERKAFADNLIKNMVSKSKK
jgi:hypothetical protein